MEFEVGTVVTFGKVSNQKGHKELMGLVSVLFLNLGLINLLKIHQAVGL